MVTDQSIGKAVVDEPDTSLRFIEEEATAKRARAQIRPGDWSTVKWTRGQKNTLCQFFQVLRTSETNRQIHCGRGWLRRDYCSAETLQETVTSRQMLDRNTGTIRLSKRGGLLPMRYK